MTYAFPVILGGLFGLGPGELIALLFLVTLLFGAKRLPELARGVGQSIKEFKKASNAPDDEEHDSDREAPARNGAAKPAAKASADSK